MHIIVCEDPGTFTETTSFAARARLILRAHRVGTSLIATWLSGWLSGKRLAPTTWFLLVEGDRVVAVAMHAEGLNVVISPLNTENRVAAVTKLTEMLMVIGDPVLGISAKEADVEAFSQVWGSQFEVSQRVAMPEFRRRGFGAAVTAYAARSAFDPGADLVMLFADRDNPGSNRVYAGLGFQPVGTSVMVAFDPADAR